ncbi:hypothetical protein DRN58_07045 [Thermococci archaeon]|nr:MAG: hypothetical protein DRN58_07045 [Thermococci archaeon]
MINIAEGLKVLRGMWELIRVCLQTLQWYMGGGVYKCYFLEWIFTYPICGAVLGEKILSILSRTVLRKKI